MAKFPTKHKDLTMENFKPKYLFVNQYACRYGANNPNFSDLVSVLMMTTLILVKVGGDIFPTFW